MQSSIEWGIWIAGCSLVVGLAKFLDEYHIKHEVKSKTRDKLIAAFFFLDRPQITNFAEAIYSFAGSKFRRVGIIGRIAAAVLAYFAITSSFFIGRHYIGDPSEEGFLTYSLGWVSSAFWGAVMLWGIGAGFISFIWISKLLDRWNNAQSLVRRWTVSVLAMLLLTAISSLTAIGFFLLGYFNLESGIPVIIGASGILLVGHPIFLLVLTLASLWHLIAISGTMVLLTIICSLYLFVHKGVLSILNAASNPKFSPFQYFSALIAFSTLMFKFFEEVLT